MDFLRQRPGASLLGPLLALGLLTTGCGAANAYAAVNVKPVVETRATWADGWSASPQRPSTGFEPNWAQEGFADQSVRQVTRVSIGGSAVRIRLSNLYGTTPLKVTGASIGASSGGASVRPGSVRHLKFDHALSVVIPAGREIASDPISLRVTPLESLSTTLYFAGSTGPATFHAQAYATSYRTAGNHLNDRAATAFTQTTHSWYYLSDVEVLDAAPRRDAVVTFGDSITDGFGSTDDANDRYSDDLAERFVAMGKPRSVLNAGIGGNLLLHDSTWYGDKATARFQHDVLDKPQVGCVIVLVGVNDIGFSETDQPTYKPSPNIPVPELIAGYRKLITQAHARGIKVIGATLLPFKGSDHYSKRSEAKREEINHWIRTSSEYDGVVDFDRVMAASSDPERLNPAYDSGDHLHPNDAGYRVMAQAVTWPISEHLQGPIAVADRRGPGRPKVTRAAR
jgi:lysophospholipase L1-like esterase